MKSTYPKMLKVVLYISEAFLAQSDEALGKWLVETVRAEHEDAKEKEKRKR